MIKMTGGMIKELIEKMKGGKKDATIDVMKSEVGGQVDHETEIDTERAAVIVLDHLKEEINTSKELMIQAKIGVLSKMKEILVTLIAQITRAKAASS